MKRVLYILFISGFLLLTGQEVTAQVIQQRDTLRLGTDQATQAESVNEDRSRLMQRNQNQNRVQEAEARANAAKANAGNAANAAKQIKSARPDMSKARGARPPTIVRPGGSGIPKGIGKPGGVGRKGGR